MSTEFLIDNHGHKLIKVGGGCDAAATSAKVIRDKKGHFTNCTLVDVCDKKTKKKHKEIKPLSYAYCIMLKTVEPRLKGGFKKLFFTILAPTGLNRIEPAVIL